MIDKEKMIEKEKMQTEILGNMKNKTDDILKSLLLNSIKNVKDKK